MTPDEIAQWYVISDLSMPSTLARTINASSGLMVPFGPKIEREGQKRGGSHSGHPLTVSVLVIVFPFIIPSLPTPTVSEYFPGEASDKSQTTFAPCPRIRPFEGM